MLGKWTMILFYFVNKKKKKKEKDRSESNRNLSKISIILCDEIGNMLAFSLFT